MFLRPGVYTYTIRYRVDRELGFFKDFDELYWNVTGNGWTFAIDRAEAVIELPPGAKILKSAAYTGYQGGRGQDFTGASRRPRHCLQDHPAAGPQGGPDRGGGLAQGRGARALRPGADGLLPPGQRRHGHRPYLAGRAPGFYLWVWYRVGRDPATGTIIPLFTPPAGFSPAGVRFVSRMGYDDKAFAAAVVDMAVKGGMLSRKEGGVSLLKSTTYTLHKERDQGSPVPGRAAGRRPTLSPGRADQTGKQKPHR